MNIENHVTSLELSKRLKELGVMQDSIFKHYISEPNDINYWHDLSLNREGLSPLAESLSYSAFTASELGEMLPLFVFDENYNRNSYLNFVDSLGSNKTKRLWSYNYLVGSDYGELLEDPSYDKNEANSRAKLLIALIEKGYVKVEDINAT